MRLLIVICAATVALAEENATTSSTYPTDDELAHFPRNDYEERGLPVGKQCWADSQGYTEDVCCPIRPGRHQADALGYDQCWQQGFTYESCCLYDNDCDGVVFQQFRMVLFKYIDDTATEEDQDIFHLMLNRGVFMRAHAIKSCPSVGMLAGWLASIEHLMIDPTMRGRLMAISKARTGSESANRFIGGGHHWVWSNWAMWESVSLLSGTHGYSTEPNGIDGVGAFHDGLARLHNQDAVGHERIMPNMFAQGIGPWFLDMVAGHGASLQTTLDEFVISSSFSTPYVLNSIAGPFAAQPRFPAIENQTEKEVQWRQVPVYLNGEKWKVFTKHDLDGVLVGLFDRFIGHSELKKSLENILGTYISPGS